MQWRIKAAVCALLVLSLCGLLSRASMSAHYDPFGPPVPSLDGATNHRPARQPFQCSTPYLCPSTASNQPVGVHPVGAMRHTEYKSSAGATHKNCWIAFCGACVSCLRCPVCVVAVHRVPSTSAAAGAGVE